jgi:hypothetical protein
MKFYTICILGILFDCIWSGGCIQDKTNNQNGAITALPTNQITTSPTIDEKMWETVVDSKYVLIATGGGLNEVSIPVSPNTAYRLNVDGEKPLEIQFYSNKVYHYNDQGEIAGYSYEDSKIFARGVVSFNEIVKTNSAQTNILIRWEYLSTESNIIGTSQNVKVKLERYKGEPTIFADTTAAPVIGLS